MKEESKRLLAKNSSSLVSKNLNERESLNSESDKNIYNKAAVLM
jgi:hypothetical protein